MNGSDHLDHSVTLQRRRRPLYLTKCQLSISAPSTTRQHSRTRQPTYSYQTATMAVERLGSILKHLSPSNSLSHMYAPLDGALKVV